ncbi:MAG: hypothetical protein RJB50_1070 [Actinomycetota bacterium]
MILSVLALGSGLLNATPFGESWERMKLWVEPRARAKRRRGVFKVCLWHRHTRKRCVLRAEVRTCEVQMVKGNAFNGHRVSRHGGVVDFEHVAIH